MVVPIVSYYVAYPININKPVCISLYPLQSSINRAEISRHFVPPVTPPLTGGVGLLNFWVQIAIAQTPFYPWWPWDQSWNRRLKLGGNQKSVALCPYWKPASFNKKQINLPAYKNWNEVVCNQLLTFWIWRKQKRSLSLLRPTLQPFWGRVYQVRYWLCTNILHTMPDALVQVGHVLVQRTSDLGFGMKDALMERNANWHHVMNL